MNFGWPAPWLAAATILLAILAFQPVFGAGFVDWDDPQNFLDNARWRSFSAESLRWMFTTPHMGHFSPLTWLTFALDAATGDARPERLHVTSVVLHGLSAGAFLLLARRLFAAARPSWSARTRDLAAALAAALFAVHPLRCESVCWLTERRDVLSGLFLSLALLAWCRYAQEGERRRDLVLALVAFVLAWASKGTAIVLPVLLLIVDAWPLRRWNRASAWQLVREKLAFLALMPAMAWITLWAAKSAGATLRGLDDHGPLSRIAQASYATLFYPAKTLVPVDLRPIYSLSEGFDPSQARFLGALAAALAISVVAIVLARRAPAFLAAWSAYLVVLAPVSGLLQAGPQLVAERYSYTAMQPFALLAAAACIGLAARSRAAAWSVSLGVLAALFVATRAQSAIWNDSATLWKHTLAVDPDNPHALLHAGALRYRAALEARQQPQVRRAALDEALALYRRGSALSRLPHLRMNEALALALDAETDAARRNELLGRALELSDEAFRLAREGFDIDPLWHVHRASFLFKLGRAQEALPEMEAFVALRPEDPQAQRTLAVVCAALKLDERHEQALRRASELDPADALSCVQLARLLAERGNPAESQRFVALARARRARGAPLPPAEASWLEQAPAH